MSTPSSSGFSIYAELLPNIRQISIAVSLPSDPTPTTRAEIFADGNRIGIRHGGKSKDLLLPGTVVAASPAILKPISSRSPSWRLPLAPSHTSTGLSSHDHYPTPPWSALDLKSGSSISCRQCDNVFVPGHVIGQWKDLPSENWAEMMEFWHCHKPDEHDKDHEHLMKRGYGASATIAAQEAVGFIDLTSFLFAESDTRGIKYPDVPSDTSGDGPHPRVRSVMCAKCHSAIGLFESQKQSVSLFKWQVNCQTLSPTKAPSAVECLAATLVATVSRSGSAKAVILPISQHHAQPRGAASMHSAEKPDSALHIWVLNQSISYTSTGTTEGIKPAIKLLYRIISHSDADKLIEPVTSDIQDLSLAQAALMEAVERLGETNGLLPQEQRHYQEWRVGLLDRYEK